MPDDLNPTELSDSADLFVLPLEEYTAARDLLASRLRTDGDLERATVVAKLRKPSVAAWAINRAARHHPELVDQLLESHRQLREAGSAAAVQIASEERRRAVTALLEASLAEIRADGRPDTAQTRQRIGSTLLAVATDLEGEADLQAGTLTRELEPSGGGWGEMTLPAPPVIDPGAVAGHAAMEARARAGDLEAEALAAERRLELAKQALTESRRRAKQARLAADQAARDAESAEKSARELGG
jgi:hypothetical protein